MFWCDRRRFLAALLGVSDSRELSRVELGRWRARPPLLECGAAGRCLPAPVSGLTSRDGFFAFVVFFCRCCFCFFFFLVFFVFFLVTESWGWLGNVGVGPAAFGVLPVSFPVFFSRGK